MTNRLNDRWHIVRDAVTAVLDNDLSPACRKPNQLLLKLMHHGTRIHWTVSSLRRNRDATYNIDVLITNSETVFHPRRQIDDGAARVQVASAAGAAPFKTVFPGGWSCGC